MELETAAAQLEALGNPSRLSIFRLLVQAGCQGLPVGQVQKHLNIPASTLSHHLSKLVQASLIVQERESRTLHCKVDYSMINGLLQYLIYNCCGDDCDIQIKHLSG